MFIAAPMYEAAARQADKAYREYNTVIEDILLVTTSRSTCPDEDLLLPPAALGRDRCTKIATLLVPPREARL
jgi:hypothetical protein